MLSKTNTIAKKPVPKKTKVVQTKKSEHNRPFNTPIDHIMSLHQTLGNQAVQRLFESDFIQGKLIIGKPNDKYEQEADRVADEVMRMPEPQVQRQSEEDEEEEMIQTKPIGDQITPLIQRQVEPEEEEEAEPEKEEEETIQTKAEGQTPDVTPSLESRINALQGGGKSLSKETRNFFEPRFGQDFSNVKVHADPNANQLARSINARAFTKGSDVVFGDGEYSPGSFKGKRLLGHELTHVVQQGGTVGSPNLNRVQQQTIQKQDGEPEAESPGQTTTRNSTSLTVPGPFGDIVLDNYAILLGMSRLYISILEDNLDEVESTASVYRRAQDWIDGGRAWQSVLEERGDEALSPAAVAQARLWVHDYTQILEDIRTYKRNRTIRSLRSAQSAINRAASQMNTRQPKIDEALRAAFLSGDTDAMAQVTGFIGNVLDIGLDLSSLSRKIGSEITKVRGGTIPEASRYTSWLENINRALATANLVYSVANIKAPTELGSALNGVNTVADAFSAGGTLLGLAPHIGLYANLYLVPLTQVITARLGYIIDQHLHELNIVSQAIGWGVDMSNEPGGWPVFYFIYEVMHAESAFDIPGSIPGAVEDYFLSQRKMIEAGTGEEVPTTGWWFWRGLDKSNIRRWIFNNRERLWAMFYGQMEVPERRPRRKI